MSAVAETVESTIARRVEAVVRRGQPEGADEDDDFMYAWESDEFQLLMDIARHFRAKSGTSHYEGELFARKFERHIADKYPELSYVLDCDGSIYEAVAVELGSDSE